MDIKARLDELSAKQAVDGVTKTIGTDGGAKVAKEFADQMAAHLSEASTISRLTSSLNKLETYGDPAGKAFAENMAKSLEIHLKGVAEESGNGFMQQFVTGMRQHSELAASGFEAVEKAAKTMGLSVSESSMMAAGGLAAVGLAAVEVGKHLFEMGEKWADLEDKITFTTGRTGDSVKQMTDQIAEIGNSTAAPLETIGDVYTQLTRLKDLQGETLGSLTKQVSDYDQMAKQAGSDPLNVHAFTQAMQEFHVPAEQMGKDLDVIKAAADDGRIPVNELIDQLHSAGPTADLTGLSFGQVTNVLASMESAGVDTTKALQGLRIGMGTIAADSKSLQKQIHFAPDESELQRLKDVVQKIQDLHQAAQDTGDASRDVAAIDLGKSVFGRSWSDIGQSIIDGKLNVDAFNKSLDDTGNGIEKQRDATKHFGDDWQLVKNRIEDALKPLSEFTFDKLDKGLSDFYEELNPGKINWSDQLFGVLGNGPNLFDNPASPGGGAGAAPGGSEADHQATRPHNFGDPLASLAGGANLTVDDLQGTSSPGFQKAKKGSSATDTATGPNISAPAPFHPLDLNAADMPAGKSYDEWVSSQKAVQSALDRVDDTAGQEAAANAKMAELLKKGHASQSEWNSVTDELNKAKRDNLQATQDLTIAQTKETETSKKKSDNPWDANPFDKVSGDSGIAKLASLATMFVTNLALGNPVGKLQAEKLGASAANPMYVSDVTGKNTLSDIATRYFTGQAGGQQPAGGSPVSSVQAAQNAGVSLPWGAKQQSLVGPGGPGTSPNGFPLLAPESSFSVNGVTAQAASGAPAQRLQQFAQWFNDNIEPIKEFAGFDKGGHGLGNQSNHTSGTALDINWDDFSALQGHGADARSHFSPAQMQEISQELAQSGMTWGQYWTPGERDPGHFELGGASYDKGAQNVGPMAGQPAGATNPWINGGAGQGVGFGMPGGPLGPMSPAGNSVGGGGIFAGPYGNGPANASAPGPLDALGKPGAIPGMNTATAGVGAAGHGGAAAPPGPTSSGPPPAGGGPGFSGLGGLPLAALQGAASAIPIPGAGQAAQIAIQEGNRAVQYAGQVGAIAVQGAQEEFALHDPDGGNKKGGIGWIDKIAGGLAGAKPAAPNTAGKTAPPDKNAPNAQQQGNTTGANGQPQGGGANGGNVGVNIENMHVASPDHGQQVAGDLNYASYASQMATR
jgi:TP901 family phage tail tape measure protein